MSSTPRPSVRFAAGFVAGAVALTGVIGVVVAPALAAAPAASSHASADHAGSGLAPVTATAGSTARRAAAGQTLGMDVSSYQGNVNWAAAWNAGARFAYTKSTEGTGYTNPYFAQQYNGAYRVGMIRGAYHFALPDRSSGTAQADYFIRHGGGWSADGRTLPPGVGHRVQPLRRHLLRAEPVIDGVLDSGVQRRSPGPRRPLPHHLHHQGLVGQLHRQHHQPGRRRPPVGGPVCQQPRHAARGLADVADLAVRLLGAATRRSGRLQRLGHPTAPVRAWPLAPAKLAVAIRGREAADGVSPVSR